jgi:hypothetical protein
MERTSLTPNNIRDAARASVSLIALCYALAAGSPLLTAATAAASDARTGTGLRIADEAPGGSSVIGPLRRGPNGEIEVITPSKAARNKTCSSSNDAKSGTASGHLDSLAPGHWLEVANSKLAAVLYKGPLADELRGNTGPAGIMSAWGGATFDTNSEALLVWGGGHQDYYGNEVYAFSLKTLQWRRLNEPSSIAGWSRHTGILPDGAPSARHTYGALTFLPRTNQMFSTASSGSMPDGGSTPESWLFNLSTNRWTRAADALTPRSIRSPLTIRPIRWSIRSTIIGGWRNTIPKPIRGA